MEMHPPRRRQHRGAEPIVDQHLRSQRLDLPIATVDALVTEVVERDQAQIKEP
jgi:hypothetical protein